MAHMPLAKCGVCRRERGHSRVALRDAAHVLREAGKARLCSPPAFNLLCAPQQVTSLLWASVSPPIKSGSEEL